MVRVSGGKWTSWGHADLVSDYVSQTDTASQTMASWKFAPTYTVWVSGGTYYAMAADGALTSNAAFHTLLNGLFVGGDKTIYTKAGAYSVAGTITPNTDNVSLIFERGAILTAVDNLNAQVIYVNADNNIVHGVTIDGNAVNQAAGNRWGIGLDGVNSVVENAVIYNCRVHGVDIGTLGSSVDCGVINSRIYSCGWNGITNWGLRSFALNNAVSLCSDVGISTYGVGMRIAGNHIFDMQGTTGDAGNTSWGVGIEGGSDSIVEGNYIDNCLHGLYNSGFPNTSVLNNRILCGQEAQSNGITSSGDYNTIKGNIITDAHFTATWTLGIGIYLINSEYNLVSDNNISNNDSCGILLDTDSNYNTISNNLTIHHDVGGYVSGIGIIGDYNSIKGNESSLNTNGIALGAPVGTSIINNYLSGNVTKAIDLGTATVTKIITNYGYNPVGNIATPWANGAGTLSDAAGALDNPVSDALYTVTDSPKLVILTNCANITAVQIDATTLTNITTQDPQIYQLNPGQTIHVVWTAGVTPHGEVYAQ